MDVFEVDNVAFDSPTCLRTLDSVSGLPRRFGFDDVIRDHCFFTVADSRGVEQIGLTREEITWLLNDGLPAILREMDASDEVL